MYGPDRVWGVSHMWLCLGAFLCVTCLLFLTPQKLYKSSWENQKAKGFELSLDSLAFLAAKAKRDLASEVSE